MRKTSPVTALAVGAAVVAAVATLLVQGGWCVWVPVLPALLVACALGRAPGR